MKKFDIRACIKNIPRILLIALLAFLLDYLIVQLTDDESIWLGESIEVVGSAFFGPFIGGMAALINCAVSDYLMYGSYEYSYLAVLEIISVVLIGIIFKRLCKDDSKFGVREILIFNFVQLLINVCVLFLATPPLAITFFGFLTEDWTTAQFADEMASLRSYAFSSGISVALIGTPLMDLLDAAGGLDADVRKVIVGGPMMGNSIPSLAIPVTKNFGGLLALAEEGIAPEESACIRCGRCVRACPMGLMPTQMDAYIRHDDIENAVRIGVLNCMECGSCTYVCPAKRELTQSFRMAKAMNRMKNGK